jgi:hypothetical protein
MPAPAQEANRAPDKTGAPAVLVPFVRASDEHIQPGSVDESNILLASAQDLGIFDIPAYGYIRWLYLLVTATGGVDPATANADFTEDGPWNVLQNIMLTEPNGAPILQFTNGYQAYLAHKYGGYLPPYASDPKDYPIHTIADEVNGNFSFLLRLPIELSGRDGVGSLPNQDSAGQFKLRLGLADSATLFTSAPGTTLPTVRVRAWLEAWDQPEPQSGGMANQTSPPATGTTSFWTVQSGISVANGDNTIELKRKGNYLRQIIFVLRTSGSRSTAETDWPAETRFMRDAFPARYLADTIWLAKMFERTGFTAANEAAGGLDNGVRFLDWMHEFDGGLGRENRDLWQPTRGSTRLEIVGNFLAAATLDVITNDVAIAENVFL